ncbi:Modification methylase PvuII [Achromobacter xylosoxidans]|uniref:DNA methyltransferase n=1 Tax=Achromobacter TaxID=222 RepID=UPI0006BF9F28|nr:MULTISPECIES: DNA methyltransferase [Achromobacter]CAB3731001.1 hypothetical protein LMG1866_04640 [Achromobacter ruhlandii]CAB3920382.1 hypothetical protein LMG26846_05553 [Achromobacter insuavis]CUJ32494.1 Modification methylase PvuII [Achromobacter xylosoxidans]CUJ40618.1 Modification methylase PvuII [Achromobacter sp. 2789STDY5608621]
MTQRNLDLFDHVAAVYADAPDGCLDNTTLYKRVAERAGVEHEQLAETVTIKGQLHNVFQRAVRWHQQTLKHLGVLTRDQTSRGVWRFTEGLKNDLHRMQGGVKMVAFSTTLGVAIWGACEDVFPDLDTPIALCMTSVPYFLRKPRAYGNPSDESEYRDFVCRALEPVVQKLLPGGSIVLSITNDAFIPGLPSRSLYRERLLLDLHDRLGLHKMDEFIWHNPSKPPGPVQWASIQRVHLNTAYEPIYWLTNDPSRVRADNRGVLLPHTQRHQQFLDRVALQGYCDRDKTYGDGAYRLRKTSYNNKTEGRIPRNVLTFGHKCADTQQYRRDALRLGLPVHGAMMPLAVVEFFIRYLSREDDLVVDICGGTVKLGMAAENLRRRWVVVEWIYEYLRASAERFQSRPGYTIDPAFAELAGRFK